MLKAAEGTTGLRDYGPRDDGRTRPLDYETTGRRGQKPEDRGQHNKRSVNLTPGRMNLTNRTCQGRFSAASKWETRRWLNYNTSQSRTPASTSANCCPVSSRTMPRYTSQTSPRLGTRLLLVQQGKSLGSNGHQVIVRQRAVITGSHGASDRLVHGVLLVTRQASCHFVLPRGGCACYH